MSNENILFIRMVTGEDLIADIVWNDDSVSFVNPMKIVYLVGDSTNSIKLSLVQWVFPRICQDQEFVINSDDILTMAPLTEELLEYYLDTIEQTSKFENIIVESYKNESNDQEEEINSDDDLIDLIEKYSSKKKILH